MELVPKQYAIVAPRTAEAMGLPSGEHGLLCCVDESGERWTLIGDPDFVRKLSRTPEHLLAELEVPAEAFPERRAGWPDDWKER
jgi:hypothetical protein